jgi:hypothetical protein
MGLNATPLLAPPPPTLSPPSGGIPRPRWGSERTLAALLRTLPPRLREAVTEAYVSLGGSGGRFNPQRRRVLILALGRVIDRMMCCPVRHVEIMDLRAIQQRHIRAVERAERVPYA